jgi:hypothetical protein
LRLDLKFLATTDDSNGLEMSNDFLGNKRSAMAFSKSMNIHQYMDLNTGGDTTCH